MLRRIAESTLSLKQGDLTQTPADAIVNAANEQLAAGGGVCGAIFRQGGPEIFEEVSRNFPQGCEVGQVVPSTAGQLPARFVFHAVGPVWMGGRKGEPELLKSAYINSLRLAIEKGCRSIAFPAISTGIYGYPMDRAATESLSAVIDTLRQVDSPLDVIFVLAGAGAYGAYSRVLEEMLPG